MQKNGTLHCISQIGITHFSLLQFAETQSDRSHQINHQEKYHQIANTAYKGNQNLEGTDGITS